MTSWTIAKGKIMTHDAAPISNLAPPDYLIGKVREAQAHGPASELLDGRFCGHGESIYAVFDLYIDDVELFEIRMTGYDKDGYVVEPPYIEARPAGKNEWFAIYDTRKHPAATWRWIPIIREVLGIDSVKLAMLEDEDLMNSLPVPKIGNVFTLDGVQETLYKAAIGFEYSDDSDSSNDVGWFALSIQTLDGRVTKVIFSDETA